MAPTGALQRLRQPPVAETTRASAFGWLARVDGNISIELVATAGRLVWREFARRLGWRVNTIDASQAWGSQRQLPLGRIHRKLAGDMQTLVVCGRWPSRGVVLAPIIECSGKQHGCTGVVLSRVEVPSANPVEWAGLIVPHDESRYLKALNQQKRAPT